MKKGFNFADVKPVGHKFKDAKIVKTFRAAGRLHPLSLARFSSDAHVAGENLTDCGAVQANIVASIDWMPQK
jgi:hypothetical protein